VSLFTSASRRLTHRHAASRATRRPCVRLQRAPSHPCSGARYRGGAVPLLPRAQAARRGTMCCAVAHGTCTVLPAAALPLRSPSSGGRAQQQRLDITTKTKQMSFHVQVACLPQNFVWSTWYSVLQVPLGQMWWESHHVFVVARHCRDVHLCCMKWPRHCHKIVIAVARLTPPFCVYVYFLRPKISVILSRRRVKQF